MATHGTIRKIIVEFTWKDPSEELALPQNFEIQKIHRLIRKYKMMTKVFIVGRWAHGPRGWRQTFVHGH